MYKIYGPYFTCSLWYSSDPLRPITNYGRRQSGVVCLVILAQFHLLKYSKNVEWHSSGRQEPGELRKSNLVGLVNQHVMYDIE